MNLLFKPWVPSFDEIHQYTQDLKQVMIMRESTRKKEEIERFDAAIMAMQEVLIYLNSIPKRKTSQSPKS